MKLQLKTRQICLLFIAFLPISKLFALPSIIAKTTYEDMWISAVVNLLIDLVTLLAILFCCKRANCDFITLLKRVFGNTGAKIILFFYALYFFIKLFIPLQEQKEFIKLSLYINLPTDLFFIPFFLISFYICLKPLRVFGRASDILWIFTLLGIVLLLCLSVSSVDFSAILPVGARGFKSIWKGTYNSFGWWGDCVYLLFFLGNYKAKKGSGVKIFFCYLLGGILVILAMIFFWGIFTSIASRQKFAMTELSKYTTVIYNTGRFDYVGILCILFSCIFSLSLPLYLCVKLLQEVFPLKRKWIFPLAVNLVMAILSLSLGEYMTSISNFYRRYLSLYFFIMANVIPLFTIPVVLRRKKNEKT